MPGVLLDLDGVLFVGEAAVPGAGEAVASLAADRIPVRFLTNTTSRPRAQILDTLVRLGVPARTEQVLTPAVAASAWLREHELARPALFVPEATAADVGTRTAAESRADDAADAVVVGDLGAQWDFATLNRAFRLLMDAPAMPLIALGMTRYWRAEDGLRLDAGGFVRALEYATGRRAVVLGKPDPEFYRSAVASLGVPPGETIMVGDDILTDVGGAQAAGLRGVLVRTGKFSAGDLAGEVVPDAVLDSIADLPRWLRDGHRPG